MQRVCHFGPLVVTGRRVRGHAAAYVGGIEPMARQSYEDFLRKQHPGIDAVAKLYADLGMDDPIGWAASELKGKKNGVAIALFCHALRQEVMAADDTSWPDKVLASDLNLENSALIAEASESIRRLKESGVDLAQLTPLIRVFQVQAVRNVVALLDEGSRLCSVQPPPAREADWELVAVDKDGNPTGNMSGLHELLSDL